MSIINVRKARKVRKRSSLFYGVAPTPPADDHAYWVYLTCFNCAYTTRMPTLAYTPASQHYACPRCGSDYFDRSPHQHERAYTEYPYICRYCRVPHESDTAARLCEMRCKKLLPRTETP